MFRSKRSTTSRSARSNNADAAHDETRPGHDAPRAGCITSLRTQQRNPERVNVYLDDVFAFGLHQDLVLEAQLSLRMTLDVDLSDSLLARDVVLQAISAALNLLAYRPRAEGELRTRLRQRGFSYEAVAETIEKLRELRYLDDQDFAERWIENRLEHRPRSARMIAMELRAKGMDASTVADAVDRVEIDERTDALRIATERWSRLAGLEAQVRKRRLTGFLSRRGYGFDVIRDVLKELETDIGEDRSN